MRRTLLLALAMPLLVVALSILFGLGLGYWPLAGGVCKALGSSACMGLYVLTLPIIFLTLAGAIAVISMTRPKS